MILNFFGQNNAKNSLYRYAEKTQDLGFFSEALLGEGPAAVGKTRLFEEFAGKLADETGANLLSFDSGSEFSRADSAGSVTLIESLKDSAAGSKTILLIDEFHSIPFNPFKSAQSPMERVFSALLYSAGKGWSHPGSLAFKDQEISYNTANVQIIGMTNFPGRIAGGKNSIAILRRFLRVELTRYTDTEMRKVIHHFFAEKGREVEAKAATILSKMHRGTMEAVAEFLKILPAKVEITEELIREFLPLCRFGARGFTRDELTVMAWLITTTEPRTRDSISLRFPQLDIGEFFRHASRQTVKKRGEDSLTPCPFLFLSQRKEYTLTEAGETFTRKNAFSE